MIGSRLKTCMDDEKESVRNLAICLGISRQTIMKWLNDDTDPSAKNAQMLANHFSTNIDYFLSDDRKTEFEIMSIDEAVMAECDAAMRPRMELEFLIEEKTRTSSESHTCVPILSETAGGCGNGCINNGFMLPTDFMWISNEWIRPMGAAPTGDVFIIRASGDSMEPTICSGDMTLVDVRPIDKANMIDGIYVIQRGDYTYTKRLQVVSEGIKIISDNPRYENEMASEDIKICGRVICIWNTRIV